MLFLSVSFCDDNDSSSSDKSEISSESNAIRKSEDYIYGLLKYRVFGSAKTYLRGKPKHRVWYFNGFLTTKRFSVNVAVSGNAVQI